MSSVARGKWMTIALIAVFVIAWAVLLFLVPPDELVRHPTPPS